MAWRTEHGQPARTDTGGVFNHSRKNKTRHTRGSRLDHVRCLFCFFSIQHFELFLFFGEGEGRGGVAWAHENDAAEPLLLSHGGRSQKNKASGGSGVLKYFNSCAASDARNDVHFFFSC